MSKYESVVILDGLITEEEVQSLQDRIRELIQKEGGEVTRVDYWGKKRLTYDIKKRREGYYTLFYFTAKNSNTLTQLDHFCHIEEKVLRHMITHEVPSQYAKSAPVEKQAGSPPAAEKDVSEKDTVAPEAEKPQVVSEVTPEEAPETVRETPGVPSEPETGN
ncbi:30S ribosomal protein S6 [Candidatus Sumerlaeota bacterium]|nr:30S ribosomal protein S6 [Candidatus Sumerlaeota bacterium]